MHFFLLSFILTKEKEKTGDNMYPTIFFMMGYFRVLLRFGVETIFFINILQFYIIYYLNCKRSRLNSLNNSQDVTHTLDDEQQE